MAMPEGTNVEPKQREKPSLPRSLVAKFGPGRMEKTHAQVNQVFQRQQKGHPKAQKGIPSFFRQLVRRQAQERLRCWLKRLRSLLFTDEIYRDGRRLGGHVFCIVFHLVVWRLSF